MRWDTARHTRSDLSGAILFSIRVISLVFAVAVFLPAQAAHGTQSSGSTAPATSRGDRTRTFLGLGPPPDAAAAARGEKLYTANCAFCHGAKATGAEGPDLVRSALVLHDEKGELIGQVIQKGRPNRGMPSFPSLTPSQISDIAAFVHLRVELAVNRGLYTVQNVVTGDAKAGQDYFNGTGRCNTCHSVTGDLAHVGTKFQPVDLQAAFLYPDAVSKGSKDITVTLPSGQSFTGTVKNIDDFVVSLYDSSGTYHSWFRSPDMKVELKDPLAAHRELLDKYTDRDMHNILAYLVTLK